ncbi:MAG TPA: nucleotide disphospho-sugar-binding domain-containing protein [Solirubrobacteraceae bacterium]|nr:nucleotide disphospho-sugar-binding domain-containing protein [Solirubrobacteraceae bacterium]
MSAVRPLRVYLGAFGDPGHAFPMLALGAALVARGHTVALQTWRRWEQPAVAAGMAFAAAPEYQVFPTRERPMQPYEAAVHAARATVPSVREHAPDVAVSDILTPAPALAAELCGVPVATLVPHVHPWSAPGFPPYSVGARLPRTRAGAWAWRRFDPVVGKGLERGRREYNACRARLGLGPLPGVHTGLSRALTLVATLPQLEYPRRWEPWLRVVGPLLWEPPGEPVAPPPGEGPVVLVAPSTAQDPAHRMLRAALTGLARAPVRVIATSNGRTPSPPVDVPANAVLVPWLSYARTMPACDLVITHGGHGTLVRALSCGCPVVVCPAGGDMAENAARADWAGLGVRVPRRLLGPRTLRLAVQRALDDPAMRTRAQAVAAWMARHDGAETAAGELETWAAGLHAAPPG